MKRTKPGTEVLEHFPGGYDTTIVPADETGVPPFGGVTIPEERWQEFSEGFAKAHAYVNSEEGKELYKKVDAVLDVLAAQLDTGLLPYEVIY